MDKGKTDIVARICAKQKVKVVYRNPAGEYFTDMNLALLSVNGDRKRIETCTPGTAKKSEGANEAGTGKPVDAKKTVEKGKAVKEAVKTPETKQVKVEDPEEEAKQKEADAGTENEQLNAEGEDE